MVCACVRHHLKIQFTDMVKKAVQMRFRTMQRRSRPWRVINSESCDWSECKALQGPCESLHLHQHAQCTMCVPLCCKSFTPSAHARTHAHEHTHSQLCPTDAAPCCHDTVASRFGFLSACSCIQFCTVIACIFMIN